MLLKNAKILAIDDDQDILVAVKMLLRPEVKEIITEKNPEKIPLLLAQNQFDLILLDMNYKSSLNTGNEGIFWLRKIREINKTVAVIMITAYGDIDLAVRSVKEGANDFVFPCRWTSSFVTHECPFCGAQTGLSPTRGTQSGLYPTKPCFLSHKQICGSQVTHKSRTDHAAADPNA